MSQVIPRAPRRLNQAIRAKWQHHLAAHQTSGLTQAAYCREQGLALECHVQNIAAIACLLMSDQAIRKERPKADQDA